MEVAIEPSWKKILIDEFEKPYFKELTSFVREDYAREVVYPHPKNIFKAFELTPFEKVKVVILGQDPYHGAHQAHGLSFSVTEGARNPPSLQNIFKELETDIGTRPQFENGNLERWAKQGVLLLNATLTVRAGSPGSHQGKGWEQFTDAVIQKLSDEGEHLVFVLWGNYARAKGAHINRNKHLILESAHPSPFSAHTGFFGSKPFTKTNDYLKSQGHTVIDWV